jgi:demethylmenaquinone methyltransferase/2-methoxy-6-polyprenyl-1,4-benzoquinol methylase
MLSYLFMKILESRPRSYDRRVDKINRGRLKETKEAVAAEVPEGAEVLEIGCGTGELAKMLVARGAAVTGFDINPSMVEVAIDRSESEGLKGKMTIRQMRVEGMDEFPCSSFDAVVAMLVIGFLNVIEMLSGNAVDLTGLGNVLQIFS